MQGVIVVRQDDEYDVSESEGVVHHVGVRHPGDVVHDNVSHTLLLRFVHALKIVLPEDIGDGPPPDGLMEGADHVNRDAPQILEDGLDLGSVLLDDRVVLPGLFQVLLIEVDLVRV